MQFMPAYNCSLQASVDQMECIIQILVLDVDSEKVKFVNLTSE